MINREDYYTKVHGDIPVTRFADLLPRGDDFLGRNRITDFITVGPFVMQTDGSFESEHMYEREKILLRDYLASDGGEANIVPYLGLQVQNDYYGDAVLQWQTGYQKWNQLRFDREDEACNEALYATEQRNAVYYASFYIDCDADSDAVICYENSGSWLYLNGEVIDVQPYGTVKGLMTMGYQKAVTFKKGRNHVMFKLRPGYIADTMDISISNCMIFPTAARSGDLLFTYPTQTAAYFGDREHPREVFPVYIGALEDCDGGTVSYSVAGFSETLQVPALQKGACALLRLSVPCGREKATVERVDLTFAQNGCAAQKISFCERTIPYDGFDGRECIYSDFHFDTTYHQEQRTYALGAIHITKCILEELERNPLFKAILSEIDYLHPYYSIFPEHRELLRKAFESGRAEADCFYNQPNDLTSSGEGFVRNLIYGQLYHRDVMGAITPVYAPGDVFGHNNQMSQICKKGGCISVRWGKEVLGLDVLLRHVSPDGTALLHDKGTGRKDALRLGVGASNDNACCLSTVEAYPREKDTSWMQKTCTHAAFSVFSDGAKILIADDARNIARDGVSAIDCTSRDLTQHHSGVLLTRTDFKQANRLAENLLVTAEKFSLIASLYGAKYPEKALDKAWRQLLCAQHHDSITGTNNEISFVDLMIEYRECLELAGEIINNAVSFLSSGVACREGELPVFVFNAHEWDRKENCTVLLPKNADADGTYALFDAKGKEYPLGTVTTRPDGRRQAHAVLQVPAMGYAVYYLRKSTRTPKRITDDGCVIENGYYKITVDKNRGGGIVSLYDKKAKKEVVDLAEDGPANRIVVLREVPDRMETQHEIYTTGQKLFSDEYTAQVVRERTDVYEKLRVTVKLDTIAVVHQTITLYKGVQRVDLDVVVEDYQSRDDLFTVTFPVRTVGAKPIYDDRFATHVCTKSHKKLSFQTHQYASFSQSRIAPVNQWIELGPTLRATLADKGDVQIGMTAIIRRCARDLIRCGDKLLTMLTKKSIPVTPYSDTEQHGGSKIIHFNEDVYCTDTRFVLGIGAEDNEYEKKLYASLGPALMRRHRAQAEKKGVSVLFVRDSDNIYKKPIDVFVLKARDAKALDDYLDTLAQQLRCGHEMRLDTVVTAEAVGRTEDYGVALLNNGNIACSVEPNNMLNIMLFHTADFYGNCGKVTSASQLIPEQKTHHFTFALYPHSGSYREAKVYRKAFEFNDRLLAVTDIEQRENAFLPERKSFVRGSGNFILTSMKAGGYPMAQMKGEFGSIAQRGIALRGFETDGDDAEAVLRFAWDISDTAETDLLEESAHRVPCGRTSLTRKTKAYSIDTLTLRVRPQRTLGYAVLGREKEAIEPTYTRSWEHDLGSMPMGYLAFAASINKKMQVVDETTCRLQVNAVNNRCDTAAKGTLRLRASGGFALDRTQIDYDLDAREAKVFDITVTKPSSDAKGVITLEYTDDGQRFEDIFEFGYFNPDLRMKIEDGKIRCTVYNPTAEKLHGALALATPFEMWHIDGKNVCAQGNVTPDAVAVVLEPFEQREYVFDYAFDADGVLHAFWAAAKLMVNGRIHFAYDCVKGPHHNVWAHEFRKQIADDNGSIRRLLEM